ncbi:hypothetical protein HZC09_00400 [Candidatus Micrarchaeota archaeon]|nr:hypothetical protein [Candidatus Micrarchaeota archaeon]
MESLAVSVLNRVREKGRAYFDEAENLRDIEQLANDPANIETLLPGLNFEDNGLKQPCAVLAIILKIAKKHPKPGTRILEAAIKNDAAPLNYLCELIYKVNK